MRLMSWNVNGLRAVAKKGFVDWLVKESPDVLGLQETKAEESQLPEEVREIPGYKSVWHSGERKGYSGVGMYFKRAPKKVSFGLGDDRFDREGRVIIAEHDGFELLNVYFPSGQKGDERVEYKLDFYKAAFEYCERRRKAGLEVIVCGDFNTAHNEIDLARPKENEGTSGFLRIERDWLDRLEEMGYVDTFRRLHPEKAAYTWWSARTKARERNIGWRLDYFYVTEGLWKKVRGARMLEDVTWSDHCPVELDIDL